MAEAPLRPQLLAVVHRILRGYRSRGGLVRAITIDTHYAHIKKKLGLKSSNELIKFAINYFMNFDS